MSASRIDARDELAIRALPAFLEEAWNRGDAVSYAALFTDDCDYVALDGAHLVGRAANAKHHERLFDSMLQGSRLQLANVAVRLITADLALMHAEGTVSMAWRSAGRGSLHTYVVVRTDDGWRIAAFHGAAARPMSSPRGLALRLLRLFSRLRTLLAARRLEPVGGW